MSRSFDATNTGANIQTFTIADSATCRQTGAITVMAWVKFVGSPLGFTYGSILSKYPDDATPLGLFFGIHNHDFGGTAPFFLDADIPCTSGFAGTVSDVGITPNIWQHVCFTWSSAISGGQIQTYIGGVLTGISQPHPNTNPPRADISGHAMTIGNDNFGGKFDGLLAEVRKWDVALTAAEVVTAMNGGTPQAASQTIYLHLCGCSATEPDSSGHGNHAVPSANKPTRNVDSPAYNCETAANSTWIQVGNNAVGTWDASPTALHYLIFRSQTGLPGSWTQIATVDAPTTTYTDVAPPNGYEAYIVTPWPF